MKNWEEDTINAIAAIVAEEDLLTKIAQAAKKIGFDYCAYGAKMPVPISRPKVVMLNNYPIAWQEQYAKKNYYAVDPTVHHAFRSSMPIIWTADKFSNAGDMWENANGHGLKHGWAQSSRDVNGMVGLLSLARSDDSISNKELLHNQAKMTWLVQVAHHAMSTILTPKLIPEAGVCLTAREKEILCWTAEGKTSAEIGIILSISIGTVNFHINNFIAKLVATNKTQAVAKAAMVGIFS